MKTNAVTIYDNATLNLKNTLKDFFNTTEYNGLEVSKATQLSAQLLSEIKGYVNEKPKSRKYSAEKIRNILEDLYKAKMIK